MTTTKPGCAIGIFAHNEEKDLPKLLEDLRQQDLVRKGPPGWIVVLENGSTDQTADVARSFFEGAVEFPGWELRVQSFSEGGKAKTWNRWVHEICPPDCETLIFLDADIRLPDENLLRRLIRVLDHRPEVVAVSDTPVKDIVHHGDESLRNRLSAQSSELARTGPAQLCGQCWAGRGDFLRQLVLPEGILVEDGFLKAMILTDGFRSKENSARFEQIPESHQFEAETRFGSLFRHERRILLGTLVNRALFLELHRLRDAGEDPLQWLWNQHRQNREWLVDFSREKLGKEPFFRQAREFIHLPWNRWRKNNHFKLLPAALVRTIFNYTVALSARKALRKGEFRW